VTNKIVVLVVFKVLAMTITTIMMKLCTVKVAVINKSSEEEKNHGFSIHLAAGTFF